MSAPAGWHLQPDGQERYWDGTAWTDQFRPPLPSDPTAPPPPPSWAAPVDETQAFDVTGTQAIPAQAPASPSAPAQAPGSGPAQQDYAYPPAGAGQAPAGDSPTGYGAPGGQQYGPPPRQGSGLAKGCLIAALVGVLVIGAGIVVAIYAFSRAADTISETFPSGLPTELPSVPSDLPTDGLGEPIQLSVGDGFELARATIESGWALEAQVGGVPIVNVTGMKAEVTGTDGFPVLFTMSVPDAGGTEVDTVCTAASGSAGATVDVSCVPFFGDVADATEATVTASL